MDRRISLVRVAPAPERQMEDNCVNNDSKYTATTSQGSKPHLQVDTTLQYQYSGVDVSSPPLMSQQKEEQKYASVLTSSGPKPPLPQDTTVQYQEIDIRTTHVS